MTMSVTERAQKFASAFSRADLAKRIEAALLASHALGVCLYSMQERSDCDHCRRAYGDEVSR